MTTSGAVLSQGRRRARVMEKDVKPMATWVLFRSRQTCEASCERIPLLVITDVPSEKQVTGQLLKSVGVPSLRDQVLMRLEPGDLSEVADRIAKGGGVHLSWAGLQAANLAG